MKIHRRAPRPVAAVLVPLSLSVGLAGPALAVPDVHPHDPGTHSCPDSPSRPPADPLAVPGPGSVADAVELVVQPQAAPRQLLPGTRRVTPGIAASVALGGPVIIDETTPFSFVTPSLATVVGTVRKRVVAAHFGVCHYYYGVAVDAASALGIDRVILGQWEHPVHQLFAAWRSDQVPAGIAPDHVKRSAGVGDEITFRIDAVVAPGQVSRRLLLESDVGATRNTGTLRVRATDGTLSPIMPAWVPDWP